MKPAAEFAVVRRSVTETAVAERPKLGKTDALMLLAVVLWAVNLPFLKVALRAFPPLAFNGIRLAFASLVLVGFLYAAGETLKVERSMLWKLGLLGLSGNTVYQMLFIHGLFLTTASNSAVIIAVSPVFIAWLSSAVKHERIRPAAWTGLLVSFAGLYLVITSQFGAVRLSPHRLQGDLMILAGNVFWAVYTVLSVPLLRRISPLKLTTMTMGLGTAVYLPFCFRDMIRTDFSRIPVQAWLMLAFSGFFALAVCYVIWYMSVRRVGNSRTAIYDNLIPILTVCFAWIFLGERMTRVQAAGALIVFLGVYLARTGRLGFRIRGRGSASL